MCRVGKERNIGKEFMLTLEIGGYEMKDAMLNLGLEVNIFSNK